MCVCVCDCATATVWRSEDNLRGLLSTTRDLGMKLRSQAWWRVPLHLASPYLKIFNNTGK